MSSFSIIRIHNDFASVIDVVDAKKRFSLMNPVYLQDSLEIASYLKTKKKLYILFETDNNIEETITLPAIIKNDATIRTALLTKINDDDRIKDKLLLNKLYTSYDTTHESATHRFEGFYEDDALKAISSISHLETIKRISTTPYALFSLSESIFGGKSYLCVYAQEKKNLIVAINHGVLLFSRIVDLQATDETERVMEQISDIIRTVAYAHQQYREAKFEFIAICGSIAEGEIAPMQLQASTGLNITAIDPALIVHAPKSLNTHDHLLEIGMLYLQKTMNFLPDRVKTAQEFALGHYLAMGIAFLFMLFGLYQGYDGYENYQNSLDEYDTINTQLTQTLRKTNTLDEAQLNEITAQLKSTTPLHHHFIDDMTLFKPVLTLLKPSSITFEENNGKGKVSLNFQRKFKTLLDLYLFEKEFKQAALTLKPQTSKVTPTYKTDYNLLSFESTLALGEIEQAPPPRRRNRR